MEIGAETIERCKEIFSRAKIWYELMEWNKDAAVFHIRNVTDAESRFVMRLIQRAGYSIEIGEISG
jgi:hypothetical protein